MRFCTVHTHSACCDGRDSLSDMAAAAYGAGAVSFGASGHSHTHVPSDQGSTLPADMTAYCAEVLRLREAYAGRMDVLLGIEWDRWADVEAAGFDYWIGSVHNVYGGGREQYYSVDWDEERLRNGAAALGGYIPLAEAYYREVAEVAAMRPTILGHIDLVTKLNEGGRYFDEAAPRYRKAALEALHAADPGATVLEVNTGAMARGWRTAPYPAPFLLREWRDMGGRIIFTSDAHAAAGIVWGYDAAVELAGRAGYREHHILTRDGFQTCPLPD